MNHGGLRTGKSALLGKPLAAIDSRSSLLCNAMEMEVGSPTNRSGYRFDLPDAERFLEPGEDELIVLERIFFEFNRW